MKFGLIENKKRLPFFGFMGILFVIGFFLGPNVIGAETQNLEKSADLVCSEASIDKAIPVSTNIIPNALGQAYFNTNDITKTKSKDVVKMWIYFMFNANGVDQMTMHNSDRDLTVSNPLGYQKTLIVFNLRAGTIKKDTTIFYSCDNSVLGKSTNAKYETPKAGSISEVILDVVRSTKTTSIVGKKWN